MVCRSARFAKGGRSSAAALGVRRGDAGTVVWSDGQIAKGQVCLICFGMSKRLESAH